MLHLDMSNSVSPKLLPYITELLNHKYGIRQESATVTCVYNTADLYYESGLKNSFLFTLPNRKHVVQWQFIFDLENLHFPPDIISEDSFYGSLDSYLIKQKVPSLRNWDATNAKCVLELVIELLQLYQEYQLKLLDNNNALNDVAIQYKMLSQSVNREDIEVEVSYLNIRVFSVQFCVGLKFDVSGLPISPAAAKSHVAWVSIRYDTAIATSNITIKLHDKLTELIELPQIMDDGMQFSFEMIVKRIIITLRLEISKLKQRLMQRRELFAILKTLDAIQVLEIDDELFTKISFHLKEDRKYIVCMIEIYDDDNIKEVCASTVKGKPQCISKFPFYEEDNHEIVEVIIRLFNEELLRPNESGP